MEFIVYQNEMMQDTSFTLCDSYHKNTAPEQ